MGRHSTSSKAAPTVGVPGAAFSASARSGDALGDAPGIDFATELVRHQRRIYLFIGTMLSNPADIEDVYQQACLTMWRKRDQLGEVRSFFAFACGFARHEALHLIRAKSRSGGGFLSERLVATIAAEAEREPQNDAYLDALGHCLAKLPSAQRDLLKRRYSGLESVKQMAAKMAISPASITMRLQRLRQALVKCIEATRAGEGAS